MGHIYLRREYAVVRTSLVTTKTKKVTALSNLLLSLLLKRTIICPYQSHHKMVESARYH